MSASSELLAPPVVFSMLALMELARVRLPELEIIPSGTHSDFSPLLILPSAGLSSCRPVSPAPQHAFLLLASIFSTARQLEIYGGGFAISSC